MSWESITLSDALRPLKTSPFTRDELNYIGGQYQNVHYGDILVSFPSVVDAEKDGLPYVSDSAEGRCSRCTLLQNGDIIIADTAEDEAVGKAIEIQGITDQKVVSGLHTMAFRPQEGLFAPGFLGYFLNSSVYHNQLLPLMQGIKVLSISKTAIGDTVIKYPSYKEQEKIVESLSGVDDLIATLDEAIAKKRQIKEGLMQQLLTGIQRVDGHHSEFVQSEVGVIPKDWRLTKLNEVIEDINDGPFGSNLKREHYTLDHEVRIVQLGNVGEDGWNDDNVKYTTFGHAKTLKRCIIPYGSVIIAKMMPAGRAIICPNKDPMYIQGSDVIKVKFSSGLDNNFFVYYTKTRSYLDQIDSSLQGSTRARTNISKIKSLLIPLPTIEEQKKIVEVLSSADNDLISLVSLQAKYRLIKQGMMQELLTGKTRL
jgi:type I restriction enzyme S subunit